MPHDFNKPTPVLKNKNILVTGGTGSFGQAFAKIILKKYLPRRLIIFSRDEFKQTEMGNVLSPYKYPALRFFIGDVRDQNRLEMAMRGVDIVVHAAALKQVAVAEYNPIECINTNILGAENIIEAAIRANVSKVVALSTDKAVNPVNLYGASKLAADKLFVAANNLSGGKGTKISVVRYGNVLGSRGSVVPLFNKVKRDEVSTVPITHPEMTRFWITLGQGVNFVLSSLSMMQGGEIFIPKLPSMRITDLAEALVPGVKQRIVGIRPGEKLHEVLITKEDARNTLEFKDRYITLPSDPMWRAGGYKYPGIRSKPVEDEFLYSSETNTQWLSRGEIIKLIKE